MRLEPLWDEGKQGGMEGLIQAYYPTVSLFAHVVQGWAFELRFCDSQK